MNTSNAHNSIQPDDSSHSPWRGMIGVDDEIILALNGWPTAEMKRLESPKEPTEAKQFS